MQLTYQKICQIINDLNIEYETLEPNSGGYIKVRCIFGTHADNNPSCFVHSQTGAIHCKSCKNSTSLLKYYAEENNLSYKEACANLGESKSLFSFNIPTSSPKKVSISPKLPIKNSIIKYEGYLKEFNPTEIEYTSKRGYTKEYCEKHDIKLGIGGKYHNYMITPIQCNSKGIELFEARRILEKETLDKIYPGRGTLGYKRELFSKFVQENQLFLDRKGVVQSKNPKVVHIMFNLPNYIYLLQSKVFYPYNSGIDKIIDNEDELDFNKTLYLSEGKGSLPKMSKVFGTNVSCTFGSNITPPQIEYLKNFKEIVIIPDKDIAGVEMVGKLHSKSGHKNLNIIDIDVKDDEPNYENCLLNTPKISAPKFLIKNKWSFK
jgi:DNA primase